MRFRDAYACGDGKMQVFKEYNSDEYFAFQKRKNHRNWFCGITNAENDFAVSIFDKELFGKSRAFYNAPPPRKRNGLSAPQFIGKTSVKTFPRGENGSLRAKKAHPCHNVGLCFRNKLEISAEFRVSCFNFSVKLEIKCFFLMPRFQIYLTNWNNRRIIVTEISIWRWYRE